MRERQTEDETECADSLVEAEAELLQGVLPSLDADSQIGALQRELHKIARKEMARRRRRLGQLTSEQELAIEALLISTVNELAHPIIRQMQCLNAPD